MGEVQKNKIKVHWFFRELFGRETTSFDLLAILIGSVSLAGIILFFKWNADFSVIKKIILTILALDIGGGVVANFTSGTNDYYAESLRKRYLFVIFHLAQPSLLIWIFPSELVAILGVMLFSLACSIIVLRLNSPQNQRIIAVTLLLLTMILSALLNYTDPMAQLIMQFFSIKLILAFGVNWTAINNE
jgi:hypothetical protein